MKTDKFHIHLPEDPCLTEDELNAYVSGTAPRDMQYRVEAHTMDCALCADALEGFQEKVKHAVIVPVEVKGKIIPLFGTKKAIYSAVAGVAVVIGAFFIFKSADIKQEAKVAEAPRNYAADSFKQGPIPAGVALEEKSNTPVQEQQEPTAMNQTRIAETGGAKTTTVDAIPDRKEEEYVAVPTTVAAADESAVMLDDVAGNTTGDADLNKGAPAEQEKMEDVLVVAQQAPASTKAIPQAESKKDKNPSRAEAPHPNKPSSRDLDISYEKGVEFMGQKNYVSAIAFFNQVLVDRQHRYYEDAKWNKAICLIEQGKKEEARAVLKEIEQSNSKYKKDATERLKRL
jgi:tetratricopeptide (TPR) repeat protein